jgi:ABC-type glycerol-3-phosphate transport system substrate-binding protein
MIECGTMKRRQFFRKIPVVAAGLSVAGCIGNGGQSQAGQGNAGSNNSSGSGKSPWVYQQEQTKPGKSDPLISGNIATISGDPAIRAHYKKFEQETGIPIKPEEIPESNLLTKTRTLLQAKSPTPGMYELSDEYVYNLGAQGYWERIDPFVKTTDAWTSTLVNACTFPQDNASFSDYPYPKGLYAIPQYTNALMLYTNMDVLEEAGVERNYAPTTFTETMELCEQLTDVVDSPMIFPFALPTGGGAVFYNLVQRAGGHMYKNGSPDFENKGFIKALEFLLGLVSKGYAPNGVTSTNGGQISAPFYRGDAGLMMGTTEHLFLSPEELPIDKPAPEIARINIFPKPKNAGNTPAGNLNVVMYALSIFSKHKKFGARYLNLVTTKNAQANELLMEGNLPIRPDVFDLPKVQKEIAYNDVLKKYVRDSGKFIVPNATEVRSIIHSQITSAIAGGWSAQKTASRIQSEVESL